MWLYLVGVGAALAAVLFLLRGRLRLQVMFVGSIATLVLVVGFVAPDLLDPFGYHSTATAILLTLAPFVLTLVLLPLPVLRRRPWLLLVVVPSAFVIGSLLALVVAVSLEVAPI